MEAKSERGADGGAQKEMHHLVAAAKRGVTRLGKKHRSGLPEGKGFESNQSWRQNIWMEGAKPCFKKTHFAHLHGDASRTATSLG